MLDTHTQAAAMSGIDPTFAVYFLRAYDNPSRPTAHRACGLARHHAIETRQVHIVPQVGDMIAAMCVARICDPDICQNRGAVH